MEKQIRSFKNQFEADVHHGLTSYPKSLDSKYFYDEQGDRLFQEIMDLPEYYLTRLEYQILDKNKDEIGKAFSEGSAFDLIELGAGDGKKTKLLIDHFQQHDFNFRYFPVDISENILKQLSRSLQAEFPRLRVKPLAGTYQEVLQDLSSYQQRKKVILFLGSNVGNLPRKDAVGFLKKISAAMAKEDLLFIGFDQKKDPQKILDAYNDPKGTTAAFNQNILTRINRELVADFDPEAFLHWPLYDPETGVVKSFLVSTKAQKIRINSLDLEVHFKEWESIHTEISQKYDQLHVEGLAKEAALEISGHFSDENAYFKNYLFKKIH